MRFVSLFVPEFDGWNFLLRDVALFCLYGSCLRFALLCDGRAYLPFAEGKGTTTADLSNSHLAPTLHGTTWVNTFTPYDTL